MSANSQLGQTEDEQASYSLRSDLTWSVVTCLLDCMLALKVSTFAGTRHLLICWVIPLQNLAVAWCILRQPAAYTRHRTGILAVPKLLRMVTVGVTLRGFSGEPVAALPSPQDGLLGAAAFLVDKGALQLLMSALGRRLPLRTHTLVQLTALALVLRSNAAHCSSECARPELAELYAGLATRLNAAMHKVLPVNIASRKDGPALRPCLMLTSWFQIVLGFVVPTLYIDWAEERQKWGREQQRSGPGAPDMLTPQPLRAAMVQVALMAAALPVAWRAVVAADWWLGVFSG